MEWCGVVWSGVVWSGVVWSDVEWCGGHVSQCCLSLAVYLMVHVLLTPTEGLVDKAKVDEADMRVHNLENLVRGCHLSYVCTDCSSIGVYVRSVCICKAYVRV